MEWIQPEFYSSGPYVPDIRRSICPAVVLNAFLMYFVVFGWSGRCKHSLLCGCMHAVRVDTNTYHIIRIGSISCPHAMQWCTSERFSVVAGIFFCFLLYLVLSCFVLPCFADFCCCLFSICCVCIPAGVAGPSARSSRRQSGRLCAKARVNGSTLRRSGKQHQDGIRPSCRAVHTGVFPKSQELDVVLRVRSFYDWAFFFSFSCPALFLLFSLCVPCFFAQ